MAEVLQVELAIVGAGQRLSASFVSPEPAEVRFGEPVTRSVKLDNRSQNERLVFPELRVELAGAAAAKFLVQLLETAITLEPGTSHTVAVTIEARQEVTSADNATLRITGNATVEAA